MRISSTEEYGLRCILQLAKLPANSQMSASQIAELEGISVEYASKMMHLFRKANLVVAVRGLHGGFRLARERGKITLIEIFRALGREKSNHSFCDKFSGDRKECVHMGDCSVRPVWQVLFTYFDSVLEKLSLADLVHGEKHSHATLIRRTEAAHEASGLGKTLEAMPSRVSMK